MTSFIKRFTLVASVAMLLASALPVITKAQDNTGSGLRITPTRNEVVLLPGDSTEISQSVKNVTKGPVTVQPVLNDFESDGVTGQPKLIGDQDKVSAYSLREFLQVPESFDLEPEEEKVLTITVTTPKDASPGAYFGSVLYRAAPKGQSGDGQVALVASVGSLVLLEVPGDIVEKIQINDISAYLGDKPGSLFTKKPEKIGIEIENLGNGFSQPFGRVTVTDMRGREVFGYEMNDQPRGNILPNSTRLFLDELFNVEVKTVNGEEVVEKTSPLKWPGRYTISGFISHSNSGDVFNVSSTFWYIPLWLIISVLGLVVLLVLATVFLYRKYVTKSTSRRK